MIILMILFITEIWLWQAVWRLSRHLFRALHSAGSVSIKTCRLQTQQLPLIQWFRLLDVRPHQQAPQPQTITITITITISISAPTATTQRLRTAASCRRNWANRQCNGLWLSGWLAACWHWHTVTKCVHEDEGVFRPSRQLCNEGRCGLCGTVVKVRSTLQRNVIRRSSGRRKLQ